MEEPNLPSGFWSQICIFSASSSVLSQDPQGGLHACSPAWRSGAEEGEAGSVGSLEKELVVFLPVARVPGMGGRVGDLDGGSRGWGGGVCGPRGTVTGRSRGFPEVVL